MWHCYRLGKQVELVAAVTCSLTPCGVFHREANFICLQWRHLLECCSASNDAFNNLTSSVASCISLFQTFGVSYMQCYRVALADKQRIIELISLSTPFQKLYMVICT